MAHRILMHSVTLGIVIALGLTTPAVAATGTVGSLAGSNGASTNAPTPGAEGAGDVLFPQAGNGGYDVRHYHLNLSWEPETGRLTGSEVILATATQSLSSFNLDFRALSVDKIRVNGGRAAIARSGQELKVTPARPLRDRLPFVVQIEYSGVPETAIDPDGALDGWIPTNDDGTKPAGPGSDGVFVAGEPQGAPTWFAANDTPKDKATYDISMTVPDGLTAIGNGALVSQRSRGGKTTFSWVERYPMASYLATMTIGKFTVTQGRTPKGLPTYIAVDPSFQGAPNDPAPVLAKIPDMVDYLSGRYGKYPFENVGAIVDNARYVGYALETQTKPVYDRPPRESTVVHEIAHQWFGNSVSLTSWQDIWLNEGFATWSEWIWEEEHGGATAQQQFDNLYADPDGPWGVSVVDFTDPADLFGAQGYDRGAMTLQALRGKIGVDTFDRLLRSWYRSHRDGNATTEQFVALSERVSGQQLDEFFDVWLHNPDKPVNW
ncbi:MAG: M1 family metallopeptidase [Nakamurella sp.]